MGKDSTTQVIVSSYSAELAEDFGQKTRDVMQHQNFQYIFNSKLREDTQAKGRWMTEAGGSYTAVGVGGAITGRGFKIGIIDDPIKNREEAESETYRDKVWNWYTSTFYTRQEGNGAIILILTRWHTDDLAGRLLEKEEEDKKAGLTNYDQWEVIRFPAIAEENEEFRERGTALWPEKFNLETLENIRNTVGIYDWSSLYQQIPIIAEKQEFKKEWFRYFEEGDFDPKDLIYTTTIDPAISQDNKADNSVVTTIGKHRNKPYWYRIEETAGHFDPLQLIDIVFKHYEAYRGHVWLETVAYQKSLKYFLEEEMRRRQVYFNVYELKNTKKKEERIRGLIPLYRTNIIFHRRTDGEYERELLSFPFGKHDDRIDAMASQLEAVIPTAYIRPTPPPRQHSKTNAFY